MARVSGPWFGIRGGNAIALNHPPPFNQVHFHLFIPCRTMLPRNLSVAGDVAASHALDLLAKLRSRGLESTRSKSTHVRNKKSGFHERFTW